ncbi:hypothetical protein RR46_01841 [Papilio xuthus]|uniref:Uncharacterized protein n=1 Tax=Papilio xuthus TaxID=66420 RepID=A0A194QEP0_PAPXU|nr:hypothetical protein RR46_01841 [Papilio xuthus]
MRELTIEQVLEAPPPPPPPARRLCGCAAWEPTVNMSISGEARQDEAHRVTLCFLRIPEYTMLLHLLSVVLASVWCGALCQQVPAPVAPAAPASSTESEETPEGYYAFVESPNATPPRVRPPPYRQSSAECGGRAGGVGGAGGAGGGRAHVTALNLCGDLNRGLVPRNPLGQLPDGQPYPFELIRNETLRFLSRTLPVLRADDALPRVAHVPHPPDTAHYPADSGQYPATGAHYPADSAQYPATGAHYPAELPQLADINGNRLPLLFLCNVGINKHKIILRLEERARRSLEQGAGAGRGRRRRGRARVASSAKRHLHSATSSLVKLQMPPQGKR